MEQDQQFEIVGTFNNKLQQFTIRIIHNIDMLSIMTFTEQKLFELYFSEEDIKFQWDEQMDRLGHSNFVSLWIKKEEFKIFGKQDSIQWLFNLCKGKFIFLQKNKNTNRTVIEQNETGIVYKLNDKGTNEEEYFDKVLFQNKQQFNQACIIPEELRVLKLLNQNKCPYVLNIEAIQYDGSQFSYRYKKKRLDSLKKFISQTPSIKLSQVLEIIRQLLQVQVTHYFESIKLIHNRLDLENIQYSKLENVIQITSFTYSFLENRQTIKLNHHIGHTSPECFSEQQLITTAANIYQVGILFYIMVFGNNPFGKSQEEIQKNNPMGKFMKPKENGLISQKLVTVKEIIFEMISSMMSMNPLQRKSASHYLRSKIFLPFLKQKISRMEFKLQFNEINEDDTINNENKILNSIYILKTKFK
ncbi:unnamed protein product (macronuclear) [Paramecium tetraurelia]|uniref:Protein kinase domain-containing protein n=1 Tax=Paramecium tetraurelia TaxID=5888 RepID=A0C4T0_PARTE|nr:uncharacterized protein GSPATT00006296001 [Paramecium tetraurelia]CAK65797.1 unnamed protein product [Paramecium tetraurelia]|eukprot:XP_001433194.1 hypothetical protein (macronuclear) [Paramecium tetraurelia strain d4-2]